MITDLVEISISKEKCTDLDSFDIVTTRNYDPEMFVLSRPIFHSDKKSVYTEFLNKSNNNYSRSNDKITSDVANRLAIAEREIGDVKGKLRIVAADYERERQKVGKLEKILHEKNMEIRQGLVKLIENGQLNTLTSLVDAEVQLKSMEVDNENLRHDYESQRTATETVVKENTELMRKLDEFARELMIKQSLLTEITDQNRNLETIFNNSKMDMDRTKKQLQNYDNQLHRCEQDAKRQLIELENRMKNMQRDYEDAVALFKEDNKVLTAEIACHKSLVEGKTHELKQKDKQLKSLSIENDDLGRKLEIITNESLTGREEIERMMNEYDNKAKENATLRNKLEEKDSENEKIKCDKYALEREVERLSEELYRIKDEVVEAGRRLGDCRTQINRLERDFQSSQDHNIALQSDIRHLETQRLAYKEQQELASRAAEQISDENRLLKQDIQMLKDRFDDEQNHLRQERQRCSEAKCEVRCLNEINNQLQNDCELLKSTLNNEKHLHMSVREQLILEEKQQIQHAERIHHLEMEVSTLEQRLREERILQERGLNELQEARNEVRILCQKLEDREKLLSAERKRFKDGIEKMKENFISDVKFITKEKEANGGTIESLRNDNTNLREELRDKELQIISCFQTLDQFNSESKGRKELENQLMASEAELNQLKVLLKTIKQEMDKEKDYHKQTIEENNKLKLSINHLKEGMKIIKEEYTKEVFTVRAELQQIKVDTEQDIRDYKSEINNLSADLNTAEASLISLRDSMENVRLSNENYEKTIDALKRRLHQEITRRIINEERLEAFNCQREILMRKNSERKDDKNHSTDYDRKLQEEKEKNYLMNNKLKSLESSLQTQECHMQTLEIQLAEIHSENTALRLKFEYGIGQMGNQENEKLVEDMTKRLNVYERERVTFFKSAQKLAIDLEQSRETVKDKSKQILKQQEDIMKLKEKLKLYEEEMNKLQNNNQISEDRINKLENRTFRTELMNIQSKKINSPKLLFA
ncbi:DgyrCDS7685 [Dimorphilus gyrociliatus]|uniref:DgyrCDS7685 n=1 Tax=Dimorphilus gyrociliatus TaxID=2664684 RepID=A0A7I8VU07_9ANNE|nr:DgyrCDS7685 [Dimorphilus gyrociliatus]